MSKKVFAAKISIFSNTFLILIIYIMEQVLRLEILTMIDCKIFILQVIGQKISFI